MVGSTGDPITPYPWAQSPGRRLDNGVLLTRVGDGHTAYQEQRVYPHSGGPVPHDAGPAAAGHPLLKPLTAKLGVDATSPT